MPNLLRCDGDTREHLKRVIDAKRRQTIKPWEEKRQEKRARNEPLNHRRERKLMALSGSAKELKPLVDLIKKKGFKIAPSGKHHKVIDVEGRLGAKNKVITDENGPILISSTPGDIRARDFLVTRLRKRGVIDKNPWADDKGEKAQARTSVRDPGEQARKAERLAREARGRQDATKKLRERIEPMVVKLGGWDTRGMTAEFGRVAFNFLKARNRVECWKSEAGAQQSATQLRRGNTLSGQAVAAWNLFADELEAAWRVSPDTRPDDEKLRKRYFDLKRAAQGLPPVPEAEAKQEPAGEPGLPKEPVPPLEDRVRVRPHIKRVGNRGVHQEIFGDPKAREEKPVGLIDHQDWTPELTLKATYLMALGLNGASADIMDSVMSVAEKIFQMEVASREDA